MVELKPRRARLLSPDQPIYAVPNGDIIGKLFLEPEGSLLNNELGDAVYTLAQEVPYHSHSSGCETFMLLQGSVEMYVNNKRAIIAKGDLLHVRKHVHHGFKILEANTTWREIFIGMDLYNNIRKAYLLRTHTPELMQDAEFNAKRLQKAGIRYRPLPPAELVDKNEIPEIKVAGKPYSTTTTPLGDFHLRIPRWEYDGLKEVWQYDLYPGASLDFQDPVDNAAIYHIMAGSLHVETETEAFTAVENDLVHIPHYLRHKLTAGQQGVMVLALNVQSQLALLFEHLRAHPSHDWQTIQPLLKQYDSGLTAYNLGTE